jgi:hypothetical protein
MSFLSRIAGSLEGTSLGDAVVAVGCMESGAAQRSTTGTR